MKENKIKSAYLYTPHMERLLLKWVGYHFYEMSFSEQKSSNTRGDHVIVKAWK